MLDYVQMVCQQIASRYDPCVDDKTSVVIIVPYRDLHSSQKRAAHLKQFVPHMLDFLSRLQNQGCFLNYHIYIIEQSNDGRKFNRGKLLNIGFHAASHSKEQVHDVFIFHDVDLLPQDDLGEWYTQYPHTPIHIARVWDRYSNNPKYFGGVVSFSSSDFQSINGFPNNFWYVSFLCRVLFSAEDRLSHLKACFLLGDGVVKMMKCNGDWSKWASKSLRTPAQAPWWIWKSCP